MVRARKRKHAGIGLDIVGGDDLVDLKARNRQLQQANHQLLQRLDRMLDNPAVRIAIAVRDRLRGVSAVARGQLAPTSSEAGTESTCFLAPAPPRPAGWVAPAAAVWLVTYVITEEADPDPAKTRSRYEAAGF